ncbi:MAG: winged helix-turn-helix transcriptional regulator [Candidatus Thermoplasmatota archaeon]|nr:winged helix-turn-helix transcriptional regulator [Candidatus Thermoplasmatota archaeon]MBS3802000.1 winged helix-turn-helix transcriptional regulator [Candidatus Thermoplasmatota archaeon]
MNEIDVFKALGDSTRLRILELIKNGERCICEIIPKTGKSQPTVSQHLRILRQANLVEQRKEGTKIWIHAKDKQIYQIIKKIQGMKK